jgi:hypothetical protein
MSRVNVELLNRHEDSRVDTISGSIITCIIEGTARGVNDVELTKG